jgi:putative membrane protein
VEQVFALHYVVAAVVYSFLGIAILAVFFLVFDWLTPRELWKEIVEEKNLPLAITLAATTLAVGNIIASAIHG